MTDLNLTPWAGKCRTTWGSGHCCDIPEGQQHDVHVCECGVTHQA